MWFFVQTPLYATIWALLIGYIATYLPYGIRPLTSAFVQIHGTPGGILPGLRRRAPLHHAPDRHPPPDSRGSSRRGS